MRNKFIKLTLILLIAGGCGNVDHRDELLKTGWYRVVDSGQGVVRKLQDSLTYHLDPQPIVTTSHFTSVEVEGLPVWPATDADTLWQVVTQLDEDGSAKFADATERLIGKDLVFVLDDSLWTEPIRIRAKILSGILVISKKESFSREEAERLKDRIASDLRTQR